MKIRLFPTLALPLAACMISHATLIAAEGEKTPPPTVRGRKAELPDTSDATHGLDLSALKLGPLYEADFTKPLKFVRESDLFSDDQRTREPADVDWVLEGEADARIENGALVLKNDPGHLVFWNTREFPADVLIEFDVSPRDSKEGLAIVFFAAKGRDGGSIFAPAQPMRDGQFKTYHSGALDCYHTSYWATDSTGTARGTAHIRKNQGFNLVAMGRDFIAGQGAGPHRVRILKMGPAISVETNGKIAVQWRDDGKSFGPVLQGGRIGLRQMSHTGVCSYSRFKVSAVKSEGR